VALINDGRTGPSPPSSWPATSVSAPIPPCVSETSRTFPSAVTRRSDTIASERVPSVEDDPCEPEPTVAPPRVCSSSMGQLGRVRSHSANTARSSRSVMPGSAVMVHAAASIDSTRSIACIWMQTPPVESAKRLQLCMDPIARSRMPSAAASATACCTSAVVAHANSWDGVNCHVLLASQMYRHVDGTRPRASGLKRSDGLQERPSSCERSSAQTRTRSRTAFSQPMLWSTTKLGCC
jgi:hypothetical protein